MNLSAYLLKTERRTLRKGFRYQIISAVLLTILAIGLLPLSGVIAAEENSSPVIYQDALDGVLSYVHSHVPSPQVDSVGGEWAVIALNRGDVEDAVWNNAYLNALEAFLNNPDNIEYYDSKTGAVRIHWAKITENERVILALTSLGVDARNFRGFDLVAPLLDKKDPDDLNSAYALDKQGANGVIFFFFSLDSGNYLSDANGQDLRQWCIKYLLDCQVTNGGWNLYGLPILSANSDVTGMALQALAPYYKKGNAQVDIAVEKAVQALRNMQEPDGSFSYGSDGKSSESVVQVLVALTALNYDGTNDNSFLRSVVENLLTYRVLSSGGFKHLMNGSADQMASEQAAYALVAYGRYVKGQNTLYDMSDVFDSPVLSGDASLKSLSVSSGVLSPVFDSVVLRYVVSVPNSVVSVTIGAVVNDVKAVVSGDVGVKSLVVGENSFAVVVTAENGDKLTYTVTVVREAAPVLSGDASLKSLSVSSGTLVPVFNSIVLSYTVNVAYDVEHVTIGAAANNEKAVVSGNVGNFVLNVGENIFEISVTAEDGSKQVYLVAVTREAATVVTVDKAALNAAIVQAQGKLGSALIGTAPGQYPPSAVTALDTAISAAQDIIDDVAALQDQIDNAVTALNAAIAVFDAAKIPMPDVVEDLDGDSGVFVTAKPDVLPKEVTLKVILRTFGEKYDQTKNALKDTNVNFLLFDIALMKNNEEISSLGDKKVTVSIPVPKDYDGTQCKVYYIDENGNIVDMKAELVNGYLVFDTDHFSLYAIAQATSNTGNSDDGGSGSSKSGSSSSKDSSSSVSVDDSNSKNVDDFTSVSVDNFGSVSVDDSNSKNVDDSNNMIWWLLVGGISLLSVLIGVLLFFRHKKTKNE